jgi:hypothetical protein
MASISLTNESKNSATTLTAEAKTGFETVDNLPISYFDGIAFNEVVVGAGGKTLDELEFDDSIQTFRLTLETKN